MQNLSSKKLAKVLLWILWFIVIWFGAYASVNMIDKTYIAYIAGFVASGVASLIMKLADSL